MLGTNTVAFFFSFALYDLRSVVSCRSLFLMASFVLVKKENVVTSKQGEKRSESRTTVDEYHSVEFILPNVEFIYQFRIWNMSPQGMCIVVRKDSGLLKHLNVGDVVDLRYHPNDLKDPAVNLRTEIRHITRQEEGKFKHHSLVGLVIAEKQSHGE